MTYICASELAIFGSDNGLPPGQHQAIIWTNARILFIGPLRTNSGEILIEIDTFSFNKIYLKMPSRKWWPFRIDRNVLMKQYHFKRGWMLLRYTLLTHPNYWRVPRDFSRITRFLNRRLYRHHFPRYSLFMLLLTCAFGDCHIVRPDI